MIDFDFTTLKALTIPEGEVAKITYPFVNLVESYQDGYRFHGSGEISEQAGSVVTGFIPAGNKKFYVQNGLWGSTDESHILTYTYVHFYDSNKNIVVGGFNGNGEPSWAIVTKDKYEKSCSFDLTGATFEFSYVRFSLQGVGSELIITDVEPSSLILWEKILLTNWARCSINADGTIYNNGLGYKEGYRIRSGGAESGASNCVCIGYIPFKKGDTLRIYPAFTGINTSNTINFADSGFANLGQVNDNGSVYGICNSNYLTEVIDGVSTLTLNDNHDSRIAYVRITHNLNVLQSGENMIITVNQEIPV